MREPTATRATLWGSEDSDTAVQVVRRLQSGAGWRCRVETAVCECAIGAMSHGGQADLAVMCTVEELVVDAGV